MDRRSLYGLLFIFYIISSQEIISYHSESLLKNASRNLLWNKKITSIIKEHNDFAYHYESDLHFGNRIKNVKSKRAVDPVFHGHPKTREELWYERFLNRSSVFDQTPSLIKLIQNITLTYLNECTPVILYDSQIKLKESYLFQNLLRNFPVSFVHGYINEHSQLQEPKLLQPVRECLHFIIFLSDVKVSAKVLGKQSESKVVVVARSSQWAVHEFLSSSFSRGFINLVVIGQSFKEDDDSTIVS